MKFLLEPIRLQESGGFRRAEISRIIRIVEEHRVDFLEAWDEYFGS